MTGQELKDVLKALGWKQTDMARKMGLHRQTVCGWVTAGPPQWAAEYVQAMLAISRLYDAFVRPKRGILIEETACQMPDDEPPEGNRAADMAARLREFDFTP